MRRMTNSHTETAFRHDHLQAYSTGRHLYTWPAIGDICLGTRMIPVLYVAKESPAAAAAARTRCGCAQCFLGSANVHMKLTDRGWKEAFVFRVVDVSFSSLSNRARAD